MFETSLSAFETSSGSQVTDQATTLRALTSRLRQNAALPGGPGKVRCRSIAFMSGKGGVGKSHLALNTALALQERGIRVGLIDANLGLGNLDLLCGLNGYWNLTHVITGARSLNEVVLAGPNGLPIIPGGSGLSELVQTPEQIQHQVLAELAVCEHQWQILLIDTGAGLHPLNRQIAAAVDELIVVTTPEATSLADAYATVKSLSSRQPVPVSVLVNQSLSPEQATSVAARLQTTARLFLETHTQNLGAVSWDPVVSAAVSERWPFLLSAPDSQAAVDIRRLARLIEDRLLPGRGEGGFFQRLWSRLLGHAAPAA